MLYRVQWAYASQFMTLAPGQIIELNDASARWLQNDSPGVIVPVNESDVRAPDAPGADRMQRRGGRRGNQ